MVSRHPAKIYPPPQYLQISRKGATGRRKPPAVTRKPPIGRRKGPQVTRKDPTVRPKAPTVTRKARQVRRQPPTVRRKGPTVRRKVSPRTRKACPRRRNLRHACGQVSGPGCCRFRSAIAARGTGIGRTPSIKRGCFTRNSLSAIFISNRCLL